MELDQVTRSTFIVAGLVIAGIVLGVFIGSFGEDEPETVVQTFEVTVPTTVTETRTVVRRRTVTVEAPVADADLADTDTDTVTDEDDDLGADEGACSEDYLGACVPADATDLSCSDLDERDFESVGSDPLGLDPDEDGIACET
jgi:hypothetical protein